ncbi:ribosome maturation factor RimM [Candidiatus Paracoxiella cheracis]|uniref:ribosome maturation factor RimM n=1 Tax=Candidiatus Paracoxiella cheracis TaxID=3405120 RepID=UPI003BF59E43
MQTKKPNNTVIMGRFGSAYGVRGWLKVISFTDPIDNLLDHKIWQIEHKRLWQPITIQDGKRHGEFLVVKIEGCDDRDKAREYTNDLIAVSRDELIPLKQGEYYWTDLIGLRVINEKDIDLGKIDHLIETGSNDVMIIKDAHKERWLPYIDDVVKSIDLEKKEMRVEWDEEF